jgi:hypothetical protein
VSRIALTLYLDECVDHRIIPHLERRGITVRTAQGEGTEADEDEPQIRYAAAHGWVILTNNRGHFQRAHRQIRTKEESHGGIVTIPADDERPDRFALRCALIAIWIQTEFDTPRDHLFRWTDLQQQLQHGYVPAGFTNEEIAYALGRNTVK